MRLFRLIDVEGTTVGEGFEASDGRVVALALGVHMSAVVYRSEGKMLEDWGRVRVERVGESELSGVANIPKVVT